MIYVGSSCCNLMTNKLIRRHRLCAATHHPPIQLSSHIIYTLPLFHIFIISIAAGFDSFRDLKDITNLPDGEEQRKYRRTVYTHDDWKKHRSQDRFFYYIAAIFSSGVYKNLFREVSLVSAIATFVVVYNGITHGYTDLDGVKHSGLIEFLPKLALPLNVFTVTSPSLGLLLVFRTNTSYKRWDEARKNWGMNINHTRDLVRMANTFYDTSGVSP